MGRKNLPSGLGEAWLARESVTGDRRTSMGYEPIMKVLETFQELVHDVLRFGLT